MGEQEVHRLPHAKITVEARAGYLHVVATGTLETIAEVDGYHALMQRIMERTGIRQALVDVRGQTSEPSPDVRQRAWDWLGSGQGYERVAYLVSETAELKRTHINMTGLSHKVKIRSFHEVKEAHRWLTIPASPSTGRKGASSGEP
ncbi:MAG: hypothetical protein HOV80_08905 [Polyangiaceae bacterium]|nr:hypothetical protein [Polyangiaceae bacterium]